MPCADAADGDGFCLSKATKNGSCGDDCQAGVFVGQLEKENAIFGIGAR